MRNACNSDSHCGLACDASARDVKSLAMWVERCEPPSPGQMLIEEGTHETQSSHWKTWKMDIEDGEHETLLIHRKTASPEGAHETSNLGADSW